MSETTPQNTSSQITPAIPSKPTHAPDPTGNVRRALIHLHGLLVNGETILTYTVQRRLFALTHRRILVAATTGRLIEVRRGLFGGFEFVGMRWQDLDKVGIRVGIFGSTLTVRSYDQLDMASRDTGENAKIVSYLYTGMGKDSCASVYRVAQGQEQAWREKRRLREMEEVRAQSGGFQMGNNLMGSGQVARESGDPVERLAKAKAMLDQQLITDSEYETIKARVVGEM